jgi:hypothetical protein
MSFNKMRKLTRSADQVIRAIEGSSVAEISADRKMIRRKREAEEDGEVM